VKWTRKAEVRAQGHNGARIEDRAGYYRWQRSGIAGPTAPGLIIRLTSAISTEGNGLSRGSAPNPRSLSPLGNLEGQERERKHPINKPCTQKRRVIQWTPKEECLYCHGITSFSGPCPGCGEILFSGETRVVVVKRAGPLPLAHFYLEVPSSHPHV
jgi:hypothetical protein